MKARVGRLLFFFHYFIRSVPAALDPFYDYDYIFYSTWHDFFFKMSFSIPCDKILW